MHIYTYIVGRSDEYSMADRLFFRIQNNCLVTSRAESRVIISSTQNHVVLDIRAKAGYGLLPVQDFKLPMRVGFGLEPEEESVSSPVGLYVVGMCLTSGAPNLIQRVPDEAVYYIMLDSCACVELKQYVVLSRFAALCQ